MNSKEAKTSAAMESSKLGLLIRIEELQRELASFKRSLNDCDQTLFEKLSAEIEKQKAMASKFQQECINKTIENSNLRTKLDEYALKISSNQDQNPTIEKLKKFGCSVTKVSAGDAPQIPFKTESLSLTPVVNPKIENLKGSDVKVTKISGTASQIVLKRKFPSMNSADGQQKPKFQVVQGSVQHSSTSKVQVLKRKVQSMIPSSTTTLPIRMNPAKTVRTYVKQKQVAQQVGKAFPKEVIKKIQTEE